MKNGKIRLKIEHGIPIPLNRHGLYGPWADALRVMEPGDSFLLETLNTRSSVMRWAKTHGIKVKSAKVSGLGYRVWKIGNQ